MSKSSFLNNKKLDKSNIALICILGMIGGFLVSRAALSFFVFAFGVNALWDIHPRRWLQNKWWLMGAAWIALYAISYFWSDDKGAWNDHWQVKLPILLLPLSFGFIPSFSARQLQIITITMALMLVAASMYSLSFLIIDPDYYIRGYRYSHMLPTIPKKDHIRFSVTVALYIVWAVYTWPSLYSRWAKWLTGISIAFLAIYIHILAAKSGLVSFYLFMAGWGIYMAFARRKLAGLLVIVAIPLFVVLGVRLMPTFRERLNYMDFTYFMLKHGDKSGLYGDIARVISYKIAISLIGEHPVTGVGGGDMLHEMNKCYDKWYPEIPTDGRLVPHNQFLTVALACGIPALVLFMIWVFMPLRLLRRNRQSFFFFMVWLILFVQLMIEPALEIQFGVFVYMFFLMLQMQPLTPEGEPSI